MRHVFIALTVLLCMALLGCVGERKNSATAEKQFGTIKGVLVDATTRKPITAKPTLFRVSDKGETAEDSKRIQADLDAIEYKGNETGSFSLSKVIPGNYALMLRIPGYGYKTIGNTFTLEANAIVELDTIEVTLKKQP